MVLNKEIMRVEESLNANFYETKSSFMEVDDVMDEQVSQYHDGFPSIEVHVIEEGTSKTIKKAKGNPIKKKVVGEMNERTLRSQIWREFFFLQEIFFPAKILTASRCSNRDAA